MNKNSLEEKIKELEEEIDRLKKNQSQDNTINVEGITIHWDPESGKCSFEGLPVAMMWVDTTLAGLMSGVQKMVGTQRFLLALQSEGRNSVEADWKAISQFPDFADGFKAIASIVSVAGWGKWELVKLDHNNKIGVFRTKHNWEGIYQKTLNVEWGSAMVAGKFAGYCTRLFGENCWSTQTKFLCKGDPFDEFTVKPSERTLEKELENLLSTDEATKADMAVAMEKLKKIQEDLEVRVSERTKELAQSEYKYRSIIDSSPMGMHLYQLVNNELIFSGFNTAADNILRIKCENLIGKTITEAFPPLAATEIPQEYKNVIINKSHFFLENIDYDDGKILGAYEVNAFATGDDSMAVFFIDISERKRQEYEKALILSELNRSKKMEALALLAGGVAHDLNNILAGITAYPDLLLKHIPDKNEKILKYIQGIKDSGKRASAIVDDLLNITRSVKDKFTPDDLNDVVQNFNKSLEHQLTMKNNPDITFSFQLSSQPLIINCSPLHLQKVIMNLVNNSVDSIEKQGNITLTTETKKLTTGPDGEIFDSPVSFACLSITDTGQGIEEEDYEKLFEPFFSKKQMGKSGSGLGLTVVWNTVKNHGGLINISSSKEETKFELFFPLISNETIQKEEEHIDFKSIQGHREKILIIDDQQMLRDISLSVLESLKYEAKAVSTATEGIALLKKETFDLILLDMIIPGDINGLEAFQRIMNFNSKQRVLIVSGYADNRDIKRIRQIMDLGFLQKPFTVNQIGMAVKKALTVPL